ncbi:MAG: 2,3-bisphosphoglycerate-independent phosphoglycerate mutase [Myxococcales bacterium]|nr:2,3-bisphosphoglycerate-independent phosphoglycerate mutase [Myxococcales bacterium]
MSEWTLKPGRFDPVVGPVLVVVLDGVGLGPADAGNALHMARTPLLDDLFDRFGCLPLAAHGTAVGLPSDDDMGNSEVGHNAIGAGRVFAQGARLVNQAIDSGALFEGETWRWLLDGVRESGEPLHFIGLLSDGNVHSHERHLHAMLRQAAKDGVRAARVHALLDGRDVGETTAEIYLDRLESVLGELRAAGFDYRIASGGGRMIITMDRYEADWAMVQRGYAHHVLGEGRRFASAGEALKTLREETGATDQNLPPFVIADAQGPVGPIREGASVVFFNFRGDRAIEISRVFDDEEFSAFARGPRPKVRYAGMMQYDGDLRLPKRFLVEPPRIDRTLGEYLARNGTTQFACSETQKFGHVTYFWNGNRSGAFDGNLEVYSEIPSDPAPFEERPWMRAAEIVDATLHALQTGQVQHARLNLANGDMVGHTGNRDAAVVAMTAVDLVLAKLLNGIAGMGGVALVTADHGNCEEMFERDKQGAFARNKAGLYKARTSHTTHPVPLSFYDPHEQVPARVGPTVERPGLVNLAATVMELLGFAPPEDYEPSLLWPSR